MNRRSFVQSSLLAGAALATRAGHASAAGGYPYTAPIMLDAPLDKPRRGRVRVAFMVSEHANVIDLAGPWEVFQDAIEGRAFELYTVSDTTEPVEATGGLLIVPNYAVGDAPTPHIVSVGAQMGSPALTEWLRSVNPGTDLTMSVCTGAFQLARAGLLDGRKATTHHEFFDSFAAAHPGVELLRGPRFVETEGIATAAGLSSGIDLALRTVSRYFGDEAAAETARYMEYSGTGWQRGEGV